MATARERENQRLDMLEAIVKDIANILSRLEAIEEALSERKTGKKN